MSLISNLNPFAIEKISPHTIPLYFLIRALVEFLFSQRVLNLVKRIYKFFSGSHQSCSIQQQDDLKIDRSTIQHPLSEKVVDGCLRTDEVDMVMGRLGIFCRPEGTEVGVRLGSDDVSNLFEEKEPSLDEVKGAFDVFDDNRDGFIDAGELQKVLYALGLEERSEMENCRRMIRAFDEDGDGMIDFDEFVKIMESSLC